MTKMTKKREKRNLMPAKVSALKVVFVLTSLYYFLVVLKFHAIEVEKISIFPHDLLFSI